MQRQEEHLPSKPLKYILQLMRIPILNRIDRNYLIRRSLLLMRRLNKLLQNPLQLMLRIIRKPRIKQKIPRDRQQPHHHYTIIDQ